ncbi:MAG TPA: MFS transporter, partial [Verrucomicrobiae bacterium]|nr:MFS transporter [Verrucomicrobiae bacterium]
ESRHLSKETAGSFVTFYWASILAGRILFGFIVERLGLDRLIRLSTVATLAGAALFLINFSPLISALALILTGLGLAAIYPCMMTRTPQRLGQRLSAHAIGFQVSGAMLGAAALPSLSGFISQRFGLEAIAAAAVGMSLLLLLLHELILLNSNRTGLVPAPR